MAKAVFIQNPSSVYKDEPGVRYHFPKMYLSTVEDCVGDWVVFYEGRKGVLGYTSVQQVRSVRPDPDLADHFFAELDPGTQLQFHPPVPRTDDSGQPFESMLRGPDGRTIRGGANVLAVRRLSEPDFAAIASRGLSFGDAQTLPAATDGFQDDAVPFEHEAPLAGFRPDVLTNRKYRDASFSRMVKSAYGGRCAMSGLMLRNGGGASEVQAAHIRPVENDGPDIIQNGVALSGTLHWMFDRGLLSIADDYRILIAHNKVDIETVNRLVVPDRTLRLPENPRHHPHPAHLKYHREEVFGGLA